ncbi:hypothetical protein ACFWC9_13080 [Streptomyces goshikiensis]
MPVTWRYAAMGATPSATAAGRGVLLAAATRCSAGNRSVADRGG